MKPDLTNIIIDLQESDTWKIQLTIAINFISWKDAKEERLMHSKSNKTKFTSYIDANEVIDKLSESLRSIYQGNLETSMEVSEFISDSVQLMYYKCYRVNFRGHDSYINYPDWIKKKKKQQSVKQRW